MLMPVGTGLVSCGLRVWFGCQWCGRGWGLPSQLPLTSCPFPPPLPSDVRGASRVGGASSSPPAVWSTPSSNHTRAEFGLWMCSLVGVVAVCRTGMTLRSQDLEFIALTSTEFFASEAGGNSLSISGAGVGGLGVCG